MDDEVKDAFIIARNLNVRLIQNQNLSLESVCKWFVYCCVLMAGTGTFGRVVLVRHRPTREYLALKVMTISEVIRLKQVEHVKNEKDILSNVKHPFIVDM